MWGDDGRGWCQRWCGSGAGHRGLGLRPSRWQQHLEQLRSLLSRDGREYWRNAVRRSDYIGSWIILPASARTGPGKAHGSPRPAVLGPGAPRPGHRAHAAAHSPALRMVAGPARRRNRLLSRGSAARHATLRSRLPSARWSVTPSRRCRAYCRGVPAAQCVVKDTPTTLKRASTRQFPAPAPPGAAATLGLRSAG
jgi:hypothetical protein